MDNSSRVEGDADNTKLKNAEKYAYLSVPKCAMTVSSQFSSGLGEMRIEILVIKDQE